MALRAGHDVIVSDFDALGVFALKTANESVTSSTTLQADDQLFVALSANAKYKLDCWFNYQGAADGGTGAGGLKLQFTLPSGATMKWANFGVNTGALTSYNVVVEAQGAASPRSVGTNGIPGSGGTEMACQPRGYITTSSTSGNIQLMWAQNASNVTATTLFAGSFLHVTRIV
jgi:hypothetical protein